MFEHKTTEGEQLIEYFLEDQGIKFKREVEIDKLKGDSASYRVADFYLPKYKVYVEFQGKQNSPLSRVRYQKKRKVYDSNNIPCVYLYPENLGFLDIIFSMRLRKELQKHPELKWELFRFKLDKLGHAIWLLIIGFFVTLMTTIVYENIINGHLLIGPYSKLVFIGFLILFVGLSIYGFREIFRKK